VSQTNYRDAERAPVCLHQLGQPLVNALWQELQQPITITNRELQSEVAAGDEMTAPLRVVLVKAMSNHTPWVTRIQNMQSLGQAHGNYFQTWTEAFDNYLQRCKRYGVQP
jgi:hypothetical protein